MRPRGHWEQFTPEQEGARAHLFTFPTAASMSSLPCIRIIKFIHRMHSCCSSSEYSDSPSCAAQIESKCGSTASKRASNPSLSSDFDRALASFGIVVLNDGFSPFARTCCCTAFRALLADSSDTALAPASAAAGEISALVAEACRCTDRVHSPYTASAHGAPVLSYNPPILE